MEQGQAPLMTQVQQTPAGWTLIDDIRASIQGIEPRSPADEQLYAEGLDQVQRLADAGGRAWWRPRKGCRESFGAS